tara:strand:- start:682 stop:1119 length:438 start_codon:yes stop_codon:yes gene_type:complete
MGDGNLLDNSDGTITDKGEDLLWARKDSYQELKKWLNWDEANAYMVSCNDQKYLGYNDWRLPTKSELRAILKDKGAFGKLFMGAEGPNPDRKVSNYQSGGERSFWTSETRFGSYAWKSYYPTGKEVCVDQAVSTTGTVVRLVRDL